MEKIHNLVQRIETLRPSTQERTNVFEDERYLFAFESAMDDNFNTPKALGAIYDYVRDFNKFLNKNDEISKDVIDSAKSFLRATMTDVLGIELLRETTNEMSRESELINLFIELRTNAKERKDYNLADEIRSKLNDIGIVLEDSKEGTKYKFRKK